MSSLDKLKSIDYIIEECKYVKHAKKEFMLMGWIDDQGDYKDELTKKVCDKIISMLYRVSDQGHSGFSFSYFIKHFEMLYLETPVGVKYTDHAIWQFKEFGWIDEHGNYVKEDDDDGFNMQERMCKHLLEVLELLPSPDDENYDIGGLVRYFIRLAGFNIIAPLTGNDDEWNEVSNDGTYQNNRKSSVFKNSKYAYDIDKYIIKDKQGYSYGANGIIEFPYAPPDKPETYEEDEFKSLVKSGEILQRNLEDG